MAIKAPYNFVPFDKSKVFYPTWAEAISQDIPFADGESGYIEIEIEAKSPIYIRSGVQVKEGSPAPTDFFKINGKEAIPATSLKGMFRSVLEVLSYGKMPFVNDDTYAVRDLNNTPLYTRHFRPENIHCGWLSKKNGAYQLEDCGIPGRIHHSFIDAEFGTSMETRYRNGTGFSANNAYHKSAKYKYDTYSKASYQLNETHRFVSSKNTIGHGNYATKYQKEFDESGEEGAIVFTGQPNAGRDNSKQFEFIFWKECVRKIILDSEHNKKVIKNFHFAYFEHSEGDQSVDYKYWMEKMNEGESIPVFFQYEDKTNEKLAHMGLSFLYKLPYKQSVAKLADTGYSTTPDLPESIFGYTFEDTEPMQAAKGRVQFGHALAVSGIVLDDVKHELLSSPKASYYPMYIKQNQANGRVGTYKTYMDEDAELAGRKRYPVSNTIKPNKPENFDKNNKEENQKVLTHFQPLKAGAKFKTRIHFHNLRTVEIGALLSAITFHGAEACYHSLGMAKPLGYGKIEVKVIDFGSDTQLKYSSKEAYMGAFEAMIQDFTQNWNSSDAVKELLAMASDSVREERLKYMTPEEHRQAKNAREAIEPYSKLSAVNKSAPSYISAFQEQQDNKDLNHKQLEDAISQIRTNLERQAIDIDAELIKKIGRLEQKDKGLDPEEYKSNDASKFTKGVQSYISSLHNGVHFMSLEKKGELSVPYLNREQSILFIQALEASLELAKESGSKKKKEWQKDKFWQFVRACVGDALSQEKEEQYKSLL